MKIQACNGSREHNPLLGDSEDLDERERIFNDPTQVGGARGMDSCRRINDPKGVS